MKHSTADIDNERYAQLGFVMRSYRRSFREGEGRPGISQEELLRRMAAVDSGYSERFSHATVSRWEAGTTRPTVERLRVFGSALSLSDSEVAGLVLLAGLAPDFASAGEEVGLRVPSASASVQSPAENAQRAGTEREDVPSVWKSVMRFLALRLLLNSVIVMSLGYFLSWAGWNGDWMPEAYIFLTTALVLAQGLVWPDKEAGLRDLFWVSLFFIMALPALQFAPLEMDHFGFYTIGNLVGTHLPFMFALLVSLAVASLCSLMFQLLWRWRGVREDSDDKPMVGVLWTVLPPTVLAYAVVVVLSNASIWIQSSLVMPVAAVVFVGLLLIRNPSVNPTQSQRRFLLHATFTLALIGTTVGIMSILAVFMLPDIPRILPDHNLLGSWEINFEEMGYTRAEALERLNVGYMWHAMYLYVYMVFIMCGNLLVAVYRMAGGDGAGPDAVHSGVPEAVGTRDGDQTTGMLDMRRTLLPWRAIVTRRL